MTETQLIHSARLEKLEDLVEEIRHYAAEVFYEDEYHLMNISKLETIVRLSELQRLCASLTEELATKHKVMNEA